MQRWGGIGYCKSLGVEWGGWDEVVRAPGGGNRCCTHRPYKVAEVARTGRRGDGAEYVLESKDWDESAGGVLCGMWCDVVWCGVAWRGVVWCGAVLWCDGVT